MIHTLFTFLAFGLATALVPRANTTRKLIVGSPFMIQAIDFDGTTFTPSSGTNSTIPGTAPSWLAFKEPSLLYANDENSWTTRLFNYDSAKSSVSETPVSTVEGSLGVVSLGFNKDKTRLLGGSYSIGTVDVWDSSAKDGSLMALKNLTLDGALNGTAPQDVHRAHQVVLDPSGRFFAINDLGGDAIHVVDTKDDAYDMVGRFETPKGYGPRHGAWVKAEDSKDMGDLASHYVVACELGNRVLLYKLCILQDGSVSVNMVDDVSSYGPGFGPATPATAAASELVLASNQKDIYVSNRLSGNDTDSISHFTIAVDKLQFVAQVSSGGLRPRMMSLSVDESILFVGNMNGTNAIVALKRDTDKGTLDPTPLGTYPLTSYPIIAGADAGPQFVIEVKV